MLVEAASIGSAPGADEAMLRFRPPAQIKLPAPPLRALLRHGLVKEKRPPELNHSDLRQYRGSAYGTRTRGLCLERAAC